MRERRRSGGGGRLVAAAFGLLVAGGVWLWAAGGWPQRAPARPAPVEEPQPAGTRSPPPGPLDLILTAGTVIDGTGAPGYSADVGISAGRIVYVGDLSSARGPRLSVAGLVVAPGFINPHSHTYEYDDPAATASVVQGITTEVGGVDGRHHGDLQPRPAGIAAALDWIRERGTGVNQALFAGFGTIRRQVAPGERPASAAELLRMEELMQQAMAEGALGLSTGLEYAPDRDAPPEEVLALARIAGAAGGVYDTHVRSEGRDVLAGIQEAIRIGRSAAIPVAVSHLKFAGPANWPRFEAAVSRLREVASASPPVVVNLYPYLAPDYATGRPLKQLLQTWEAPGRTYLRQARYQGKNVAALAAAAGEDLAALAARHGDEPAVTEILLAEHVAAILALPFASVATDDQAQPPMQPGDAMYRVHPRAWGSFPLALELARVHGIPTEDIVRRMTGAVADFLHLKDRGYVREGAWADLAIFDAGTVAAAADWWQPQAPPRGIPHVLVAGTFVVRDGQPTGTLAGRTLRRGE